MKGDGGGGSRERRRDRGRERERDRERERERERERGDSGGGGSTLASSSAGEEKRREGRRKLQRRKLSDDSDDESPEVKRRRALVGGNHVLQSALEEIRRRQAEEKSQQEKKDAPTKGKGVKKAASSAVAKRRGGKVDGADGDGNDDDDDDDDDNDDEREEGEATPEMNGADADTDGEAENEQGDHTPGSEEQDEKPFEVGMRPIRWDRPEEVAEIAAEAVQSLPKKLVGLQVPRSGGECIWSRVGECESMPTSAALVLTALKKKSACFHEQARAEAEATAEEELEKMRRVGGDTSDEEGENSDQNGGIKAKRDEGAKLDQIEGEMKPGKSPDIQRSLDNSEQVDEGADRGEAEENEKANSDDERFQNLGVVGCRSVDCFEPLNKIQEGSYGIVYRAREVDSGRIVALKKVGMHFSLPSS